MIQNRLLKMSNGLCLMTEDLIFIASSLLGQAQMLLLSEATETEMNTEFRLRKRGSEMTERQTALKEDGYYEKLLKPYKGYQINKVEEEDRKIFYDIYDMEDNLVDTKRTLKDAKKFIDDYVR